MKNKPIFYSELAYVAGILLLTLGTAMLERADFGMSMIVAPAYLTHLKLSEIFPFFTFGVAEYCVQAVLLILICLITRKVRPMHFLSFVTAVLYGVVLDFMIFLVGMLPLGDLPGRVVYFIVGMQFATLGVAFFFHTYIAPEAYELFVKEFSTTFHTDISKTKTIFDCSMLAISVILSFSFYGFMNFVGISWGTIVTALLNGVFIGLYSKLLEKTFDFRDGLPLKKYFV